MPTTKRALTVEDLRQIEVYSDPQFAPGGDTYAFVSTTIKDDETYESQLFLQNKGDKKPSQWTFDNARNSHPRFSPDGKKLVFQSTRSGIPQLWIIPTDGGEARQITTFKHGATSPEWSADGNDIFFSAKLEEQDSVHDQQELSQEDRKKEKEEQAKEPIAIHRLQHKANGAGFFDGKHSQIVRYDVQKEVFTQLTTWNTDHYFEDISPDGRHVLFTANPDDDADYTLTNDLFTLDMEKWTITKITDGNGVYGNARFSPNGKQIACFGHEFAYSNATLNELYVFDITTKERICLSTSLDMQLGDAMIGDTRLGEATVGPVWTEAGEKLFFIGTDRGATGLYQADLTGRVNVLYQDNHHVFGFSYSDSADAFILGISTPTNPCDFYLWQADSELEPLTSANAELLDEVALSEPESLTITAKDGWEIQGWLLRPYAFHEGKKYPFVLEVHGGPHAMYGQTFFHELQLLAAKGYAVLYTNPRGSDGYGQEFVDACRGDYGNGDYTDLMTAVDYALDTYPFIDKERLGVTGGSYGGFMTNWIVGHTNRFKAAVTQRSISNWLSFYGVSDIGYFFTKWELGKNLLEDPTKLWEFSPLKYAEHVETPLLIVHGEQDLRCPIEQGEQLFVSLKHLKKDVAFIRYPGADHELSRSGRPKMREHRLHNICDWFAKHL